MPKTKKLPAAALPTPTIEAELDRIAALGLDELRLLWRTMTRQNAPKVLSRDLLARMIAHRVQEEALGRLSRETCKLLDRLARGEAEPVRHLKVGSVMVREHQGELHEVMVVPGGFCWRDKTYASLSAIAHAITGTSWNGPRFFGLRGNKRCKCASRSRCRARGPAASLHPVVGSGQRTIAGGGEPAMKPPVPKPLRCAIYTRKSTEHNLELAFNSLDAQREACEAYVKSQAHEGWRLLAEHYDDGGLSGASLERPALQQLLTEEGGHFPVNIRQRLAHEHLDPAQQIASRNALIQIESGRLRDKVREIAHSLPGFACF